ncbi:Chaperone protein dnaJ 10 [Camellia lanceoleosa]|uniref:Chaperone protein dnaJ 10 n=1 Tax=Camellia lanceoleosa TaxID=1840588 RepID=A0ACC0ICH3_9ERIC|nr:Chaperone protein dnaJ 10 [Camellia lanceoleosa]
MSISSTTEDQETLVAQTTWMRHSSMGSYLEPESEAIHLVNVEWWIEEIRLNIEPKWVSVDGRPLQATQMAALRPSELSKNIVHDYIRLTSSDPLPNFPNHSSMKVMLWNCRGAGNKIFRQNFRELVLGEAYQVLSDPGQRDAYDRNGKYCISRDTMLDPTVVFALLFGSELFEDYIGHLVVASMASSELASECDNPESLHEKLKASRTMSFLLSNSEIKQGLNQIKALGGYLNVEVALPNIVEKSNAVTLSHGRIDNNDDSRLAKVEKQVIEIHALLVQGHKDTRQDEDEKRLTKVENQVEKILELLVECQRLVFLFKMVALVLTIACIWP